MDIKQQADDKSLQLVYLKILEAAVLFSSHLNGMLT